MTPTKGKPDVAARYYLARSPFQQQFLSRLDEMGMLMLAQAARRALLEAFEAGTSWQKRHVKNRRKKDAPPTVET